MQRVHQMHRDHVPSLPPSFELLGSTPACAIHGMVRLVDPSAPFSYSNVSAVTLQGALWRMPLAVDRALPLPLSLSLAVGPGPETDRVFALARFPSEMAGHPEFDCEMVNAIIDAREEGGVISREVATASREHAGERDDGAWVGRVLLRVLGV